ncbi:fumarate/nitrate reduction transcriptional regulator Fnr [Kangiella sediminilitoris]|uniref:Transcriptional regulator n=1 Tax=Kangiella sediminilitoris TaxID=1144748 RepID=A0A1B3BCP7_9GAMM|nr:fumarate/nitrate reduction transcriptional regulator Fnr [Kangiella sediminilitoris]AOE50594.1 transcriptional regulator [Kangiella sediminilitoris]
MLPSVKCQNCSINQLCLPVMLVEAEVEHLDSIIQRRRPLKKSEMLFHAGDEFKAIYAVRSGCIKSYTISESGEEQITGFHLPGEIIGLDAINRQKHPSMAKAIETSSVCTIPFNKLEMLSGEIPGLRQQLLRVMSREIHDDQELLLLLSKKSADERLAAFLMNMSSRFASRGLSRTCFNLTMTRSDIANYLGLAVETVSRLFSKLQQQSLISVKEKEITISDFKALSELAGSRCH